MCSRSSDALGEMVYAGYSAELSMTTVWTVQPSVSIRNTTLTISGRTTIYGYPPPLPFEPFGR